MECQYLGHGSMLARRWHRLRCRECRAAKAPDAILRRGIERLNSEPAPAEGLAAALAVFGAAPAVRPARSRRWKAVCSWRFLPAGTLTAVAAVGAVCWLTYIDLDPDIAIPTPAMPSPNAYDLLVEAAIAIPSPEKTVTSVSRGSTTYSDYSHSAIGYALASTPDKKPGPAEVPERQYAREADRMAHHFYTLKEKEALLSEYSASLELVRRSFAYSYQAPPVRSFHALMPYLADYRQLARVLLLDAQVKTAHCDYAGAATSSLDAMELGSQIAHGSGLIGVLTGYACSSMGRSSLWPLINRLDAAHARTAGRRMERLINQEVPFADALQEEKWTAIASLQEALDKPNWRWTLPLFTESFAGNDVASYLLLLPYSKRTILNDFARAMDRQISYSRLPYRRTGPSPADGGLLADDARKQQKWQDPVTAGFFPSVGPTRFNYLADLKTQNALLAASLALRAYELEHHRLPHSLDELVPKYLTAVPADPFRQGQPLGYRDTKVKLWSVDGGQSWHPTVYSIGPDGEDDGGMPIHAKPTSVNAHWSQADQESEMYGIRSESRGDILAGINTGSRQ